MKVSGSHVSNRSCKVNVEPRNNLDALLGAFITLFQDRTAPDAELSLIISDDMAHHGRF